MLPLIYKKGFLFVLALVPFIFLVINGVSGNLGTNPIEKIRLFTGDWTLYFLLIALAVTPLRKLTGWNKLIQYRRMLGLYAFFYACLHFFSYLVLDQFFDWAAIWRDILKRPYITVGTAAFVLMIPLAVTSTRKMVRRLGKNWQRLHRLVYVVGILGVIHFLWLVKADIREPLIMAVILTILLILRIPWLRYYYHLRQNRAAGQ